MSIRRFHRRDPATKQERRAFARATLARAEAGDREALEILIDIVHGEHPDLAEDLGLAFQGRTVLADVFGGVLHRRGDVLPEHLRVANMSHTLGRIRRVIFPPRQSPCMPSRKDLQRYFESIHGPIEDRSDRRNFAQLWSALQEACNSSSLRTVSRSMEIANDLLRGHGVEELRLPTRRGGTRVALYVNQGDTYAETLVWGQDADRFFLTTWGGVVEAWERRFGRADDPDGYYGDG